MSMLNSWTRFGSVAIRDNRMIRRAIRAGVNRLYSSAEAVMLRRDLSLPFEPPRAAIEIGIRTMSARDMTKLLDTNAAGLLPDEKWYRASRRRLLDAGFGTCYVAVTTEDQPCHMQWLFTSADNERIQSYFGGTFPKLGKDETLLESGFTPGKFRRLGIMSAAVAKIAEHAATRWIITVIGTGNTSSIKGCLGAGFQLYAGCTQRWRLLRCRLTFHPLDGWSTHAGRDELSRGDNTVKPLAT